MATDSGTATYPQSRAIKTYQTNHQHGASGREAMAEATRVIIQKLLLARDAYQANALDDMCEHNAKNLKILDALREELTGANALEDAEAGDAARFLHKLYTDAILRISGVLSKPNPAEEFDALIELFKPVYKAWLPQLPGAQPETAETTAATAATPSP